MSERAWARRAALVLTRPRDVFEALRDDSAESAGDRQDVVVALAFVGGVGAALATAGTGALDDLDVLEKLVWIFVTGFAYGFVGYWVLGWALSFVVVRLGGGGSRRRTRHVLAFALAPLVFALLAWLVFYPLLAVLAVWSLALLVFGLVVVQRWPYARAGAAVVLAVVWLGALAVGLWSVLALLGRGFE
ncbi:MAG TPA: YIP1 family protein [Gaiellaceae bacterium]|nr:YIP1 family protein [Gaiellaceae bacterium]